jgi:bifunctional DNA-binding transcriptional regulator/antitoxin component of YhaV-PrlF toxin-antitoxin module
MQITSKGQVTIPIEFRKMFGFLPHTQVEFTVRDGGLVLQRRVGDDNPFDVLIGTGSEFSDMATDQLMDVLRDRK